MNEYLAWHNLTHAVMQMPLWVWPMLILALIARSMRQPQWARSQRSRHTGKRQRSRQGAQIRR
jgi:hypothetical protein